MDYNNIFTVILFVFFTTGCNDVNQDEDIEIVRFEKQFYNSDEKQLDNLKKQAEEATRYKEISREIKKIEAGLYYLKINEIEKDKKQIIENVDW